MQPAELAGIGEKRQLEIMAGLVVEASTGLTVAPLDPGGGAARLADFETLDESGVRNGVVEVTTTTVRQRARFYDQVRKRDWSRAELDWLWIIQAKDTADVRKLHAGIWEPLRDLEANGRVDDWVPSYAGLEYDDPGALPEALAFLEVIAVCAGVRQSPGGALVKPVYPSGAYSLDALTWAIEHEVKKQDNYEKVIAGGHGHLFVWLDVAAAQAALAALVEPPFNETLGTRAAPQLPPSVSVWAASGPHEWPDPVRALLRCDGDRWYIVEPPELSLSERHRSWL